MQEVVQRDGSRKQIPGVVLLYNNTMGGVDLGDQLLQEYHPNMRSIKMWKKLLMNFLVTATGKITRITIIVTKKSSFGLDI